MNRRIVLVSLVVLTVCVLLLVGLFGVERQVVTGRGSGRLFNEFGSTLLSIYSSILSLIALAHAIALDRPAKRPKKLAKMPLLDLMLRERQRGVLVSSAVVLLVSLGALILTYFDIWRPNVSSLLVVLVGLISASLRSLLMSFRIRRGYYGKNELEAREIISFMVSKADRISPPDDAGGHPIFGPETEKAEIAIGRSIPSESPV